MPCWCVVCVCVQAEGRAAKLAHDFTNMHAAIILTHALARPAINYHKRLHAMQLTDSDGNYHLFQASGYDDLMSWVIAINRAAAIYSSRPLAAAATSSSKFERPVLPKHPSKANPEEQLAYYKEKVDEIAKALAEEEVGDSFVVAVPVFYGSKIAVVASMLFVTGHTFVKSCFACYVTLVITLEVMPTCVEVTDNC